MVLDRFIVGAAPSQTDTVAGEGVITGFGFTVKLLLAEVVPHEPPEVVSVNVTGEADEEDAV